jgi:hypothetical protein
MGTPSATRAFGAAQGQGVITRRGTDKPTNPMNSPVALISAAQLLQPRSTSCVCQAAMLASLSSREIGVERREGFTIGVAPLAQAKTGGVELDHVRATTFFPVMVLKRAAAMEACASSLVLPIGTRR